MDARFNPGLPDRTGRGPVEPEPGGLPPWLQEKLFNRRMVSITGPLTSAVATQATAALLTLDAQSVEPVQLHLASPDGELAAAFALIDVIDSMRAPVHVVVTSLTGGAGVGVLVAGQRRLAYPHAMMRIIEPRAEVGNGTADQVAAAAGHYLRVLEELTLRIAAASGQPRSRVEEDLSTGRMLTAEQARDYGLIHDIVGVDRG
jgi:ATP-dependent Clp protease, protease subunit